METRHVTCAYPEGPEQLWYREDSAAFILAYASQYSYHRRRKLTPTEIALACGKTHPLEAVNMWLSILGASLENVDPEPDSSSSSPQELADDGWLALLDEITAASEPPSGSTEA